MSILVLTQTGGILKPFAIVLGFIMDYIYRFLEVIGISNIALTIILLTIVVNIILIPITIRQQKFTRMSAIINPEIQKIQKKYEGKKDEQSMRLMQAETSAVYEKYGASPAGGCLPTLIQIPILFALYRVIYNVPAYVTPVREVYEKLARPVMEADAGGKIMSSVIETLNLRVSNFDIANINKVIDALYLVKTGGWQVVSNAFSAHEQVLKAISEISPQIVAMNWLPGGLSVPDAPVVLSAGIRGIFPGVIIPILAAVTQYLSIKVMQRHQNAAMADESNAMAGQMKTMNSMMPLMSLFFCATLPAGIGIYWISSAVCRTVVTVIIEKFMGNIDVEEIVEANKEKAAKKASRRGEKQEKIDEYASLNTRSISKIAGRKVDHSERSETPAAENKASGVKSKDGSSERSIADIANMLKK